MKVVVGASSFAAEDDHALSRLTEKRIDVQKNPYGRRLTEDELIGLLQDADGLLAGLEPLNEKVFCEAPKLKAIARIGIGMDNVDLDAAKKRGIRVSNTPDGPTKAVAEMTLAACLTLAHQIIPANEDIRNGVWKKRMGLSLSGANVLMIGYGRIGREAAKLFQVLGAKIMIYDKYDEPSSTVPLMERLKRADVVSLHASGTEEILGNRELQCLRKGTILLNSARGSLVNEEALFQWLNSENAGWYWGDAHWREPYSGQISRCANAVLTPHISTYTGSCRKTMEGQAVENLLRDLGIN